MFLWTRRVQWLQPRRRFFKEKLKSFRSNYKIGKKKHIFQKNDLHKDPIVSVNAGLTTPLSFSSQSPRMLEYLYFFRKIHFLIFLKTVL